MIGDKKPVLPRPLSRLVLEFNRPSSEELLLHVQKVLYPLFFSVELMLLCLVSKLNGNLKISFS